MDASFCRGASVAAVLRESKEGKHYPRVKDIGKAYRVHSMASQAQTLQLYRDILKAAKRFPSIKRNKILADIKTEFHANKVLPHCWPDCPNICVFASGCMVQLLIVSS